MTHPITCRAAGIAIALLLAVGCDESPVVRPAGEPDGAVRKTPVPEPPAEPGAGDYPALLENADARIRRGFEIFEVLCAPCHGQFGQGDGLVAELLTMAPGDLTDPKQVVFNSDEERTHITKEGIEGTPMIGWKDVLADDEVELVNEYLRFLLEAGREGD